VLQIALEGGQHSLAFLPLRSGYRLELERYAPLDMVLEARRWDLVELLVEWGADLRSADVYTVLNTYNVELYERPGARERPDGTPRDGDCQSRHLKPAAPWVREAAPD
jgi:hypothetical protein